MECFPAGYTLWLGNHKVHVRDDNPRISAFSMAEQKPNKETTLNV